MLKFLEYSEVFGFDLTVAGETSWVYDRHSVPWSISGFLELVDRQ